MEYIGLITLGNTSHSAVITRDGSGNAIDADSTPTFRVYGPPGSQASGLLLTGNLTFKDTGSITGATNASPIVITSANHGLTTGMKITISGVGGNTNANGTFVITQIDANTFSIPVAGNASYTSGGTWHVVGVYDLVLNPMGGGGFQSGYNYTVLVNYAVSSSTKTDTYTFTVT